MTQLEIALCRAAAPDIDMIVNMRGLFAEELVGKQEPDLEHTLQQSLKAYFAEELNKTCFCSYAKADEQVVSIAVMVLRKQPGSIKNPSGKWGYLMNVFTLPAYRRKGISSLVMRDIMDWAADLGIGALELHATAAGAPVYEQLGFKVHPEPTYRKVLIG
jgi:GNAT superfamily N-acetyltransferase